MTRLTPDPRQYQSRPGSDDGRRQSRSSEIGGLFPQWLVAGLAIAGLGALMWNYIEPDLRRYLKIRNM